MKKVKLGSVLIEEKTKIGLPDGGGLDLIGVSNEYGLHTSRAQRIADLSRYKIIKIGWFAYNPMRVNVGSIGIAKEEEHVGIVSPDYVVFSCTDKIMPEYLLYFLRSDIGLEAIEKNASGAVRKRLYYSDLARIELNVPSVEKQREILDSISKINAIVSQIQDPNRLAQISVLKQSILQEAIQGKLTAEWRAQMQEAGIETEPASELLKRIQAEKTRLIKEKKIKKEKPLPTITEEEKPFELPEGWEWCRLGELGEINPRNQLDDLIEVSFIPMASISQEFGIKPNSDISRKWVEVKSGFTHFGEDDVAVAKITPCFENSKAAIFKNLTNGIGAGTTELHVFRNVTTSYLITEIIYLVVKSPLFLKIGESKMTGTAGQKRIPLDFFKNWVIAFPPFEEQKAIIEKVESLMAKCQELEKEITLSEQHAQMLMQAVLKEGFEG
ncbi:restriction endonuclease subunit S [Algoriphagus yeomjeoni]|uniref:restriction endonuclease subunit S n=1 Tax=Algoriphagus yeomjeoni TaxID=291403 RepID=UPI003CE4C55A